MLLNARHWACTDEQVPIEVRPWSGAAAELLNTHLTAERAKNAVSFNAGLSVIFGIGAMVYMRAQQDAILRQTNKVVSMQAKREELRRQEQTLSAPSNGATPPETFVTGTGAAPTSPGPIRGIGDQPSGLS